MRFGDVEKFVKKHKYPVIVAVILLVLFIFQVRYAMKMEQAFPSGGAEESFFPGSDPPTYYRFAKNLVAGKGYTDVYYPPGNTYVLAFFMYLMGASTLKMRIAYILLGIGVNILTYLIFSRLINRKAGLVAMTITVIDPAMRFYSVNLFTEIQFTFFLLLSTYFLILYLYENKPLYGILGGAFAGFTAYTKSWSIGMIVAFFIAAYFRHPKFKKVLVKSAYVLGGMAVLLLILTLRNYAVTGDIMTMASGSSLMFRIGNNEYVQDPGYIDVYPPEVGNPVPAVNTSEMSEAERAKYWQGITWNYMLRNPGRDIVKAKIFFFKYWLFPNKNLFQGEGLFLLAKKWFMPWQWALWLLALLGIIFSLINDPKRFMICYMIILMITFAYLISIYLARYKFPLIPFQAGFAAYFISLIKLKNVKFK